MVTEVFVVQRWKLFFPQCEGRSIVALSTNIRSRSMDLLELVFRGY